MNENTVSWAKWLVVEMTHEQAFQLEADSRAIMEDENHKEVALLCSALTKQNFYQKQVINQAVERIAELEARLVSSEIREERGLWRKVKKSLFR